MHGRCSAWALALTVGLAAPSAGATPPDVSTGAGPEPSSDEAALKRAAKAEVAAASEAFGAGNYADAIAHYEAAMVILPAPKLHYNIGVCHQRLALEADSPHARTLARDHAIESYNAYLEQNPRADDRLEVAATIRELGGTPVTMPDLKSPFDTDPREELEPDPGEPSTAHASQADTADPAAPGAPSRAADPVPPNRARVGVNLLGGYGPDVANARQVDAPALFGAEFYGGGMLGSKRRFLLGAYGQFHIGATLRADGYGLSGYALGLLAQQNWVVGRDALLIAIGGVGALTGQALAARDIVAGAPACRLDDDDAVAARRSGGLLAPRFDLGILLGPRRRGMLGLVVMPSVAIWADGPSGTNCEADTTPWTALGLHRRWQFQLWVGAGFSVRF